MYSYNKSNNLLYLSILSNLGFFISFLVFEWFLLVEVPNVLFQSLPPQGSELNVNLENPMLALKISFSELNSPFFSENEVKFLVNDAIGLKDFFSFLASYKSGQVVLDFMGIYFYFIHKLTSLIPFIKIYIVIA